MQVVHPELKLFLGFTSACMYVYNEGMGHLWTRTLKGTEIVPLTEDCLLVRPSPFAHHGSERTREVVASSVPPAPKAKKIVR